MRKHFFIEDHKIKKIPSDFVHLDPRKKRMIISKLLPNKNCKCSVTFNFELTDQKVSAFLKNSIALQLYPDGASQNRSSLMTLFAHQAIVITTFGRNTDQQLAQNQLIFASNPNQAIRQLCSLLNNKKSLATSINNYKSYNVSQIRKNNQQYLKLNSWTNIAQKYAQIFQSLIV
ncbi:MAG: hypothetical protein GF332_00450 [Candidatus Moranbacteria bacterium]|nr:hypothetical protein [Candidatus Moranbacteria bacterium]